MMLKEVDKKTGALLYGWILLSVLSLVVAGLFAFLIAMSRTPLIQDFFWIKDFFHKGLVGHVTLAFVVWFLSFMGALWTVSAGTVTTGDSRFRLGWVGLYVSSIGALLIIITTLSGLGSPALANYVPVLTHPLFYSGLLFFALGIFMLLLDILPKISKGMREQGATLLTYGMGIAGLTVLIAFVCFGLAWHFLSSSPTPPAEGINFELLFWGGGHILQFANTISMIVVWIFLLHLTLKVYPLRENILKVLLGSYLLFILPAPLYYFIFDIQSPAHKDNFTRLMEFGIGPPTGVLIIAVTVVIIRQRLQRGRLPWGDPMFSSLALSVLVFTLGGVISLTIRGSNVKIPAHYHSVIGAVTLAFMGITYHLLSLVNREVYLQRLSRIQPYLYGLGVLIFSLGLFWAGSHGVPRKTPGAAQHLDSYTKLAGMGLMGLGGIIAILGGAAFVINAIFSLVKRKKIENEGAEEETYGKEFSVNI